MKRFLVALLLLALFFTLSACNFDGAKVADKTATVKPNATPTATKAAENVLGSRKNPVPVGTEATAEVDNYLNKYSVTIKITQVVRGEEAWNLIHEENQFNDEPAEGFEYLLVKVWVRVNNVKDDEAVDVNDYSFDAFTGKNEELDRVIVVCPKPSLDGKLYAEAETEGYLVVQAKKDDTGTKIVYELGYDGAGGVWFSLNG